MMMPRLYRTQLIYPVPPVLPHLKKSHAGGAGDLIVIEYLHAENLLLKERLRGKRIGFTGAERALLARKAKAGGAGRAETRLDCLSRYPDV